MYDGSGSPVALQVRLTGWKKSTSRFSGLSTITGWVGERAGQKENERKRKKQDFTTTVLHLLYYYYICDGMSSTTRLAAHSPSSEQLSPVKFPVQMQLYPPTLSKHTPPFWQGVPSSFSMHSFLAVSVDKKI